MSSGLFWSVCICFHLHCFLICCVPSVGSSEEGGETEDEKGKSEGLRVQLVGPGYIN